MSLHLHTLQMLSKQHAFKVLNVIMNPWESNLLTCHYVFYICTVVSKVKDHIEHLQNVFHIQNNFKIIHF